MFGRFRVWRASYWEQVRGNVKWDATKTAGIMAMIALCAVVLFLREGPAGRFMDCLDLLWWRCWFSFCLVQKSGNRLPSF
jgi:hypothetical protein